MADVLATNLSVSGNVTFSSTADSAVAIGGALGTTVPPGPVRVSMVRGGLAGGALVGIFYGEMNGAGGSIQGVEGYVVANPGVGQLLYQALPCPANAEFRGAGRLEWSKSGGCILNSPHATGRVGNHARVFIGPPARFPGNLAELENFYGIYNEVSIAEADAFGGEAYLIKSDTDLPVLIGGDVEITADVTANSYTQAHGGTDYDVLPAMTLTAPPSPAQIAAAPEGCLFIVAP
jgi:hypothetical protein